MGDSESLIDDCGVGPSEEKQEDDEAFDGDEDELHGKPDGLPLIG
jgi:hypothetical protein